MIKKREYIFIYIMILIEFLILCNSKYITNSIIKGSLMFLTKVFPSLFPTMLIGMILIKNNVINIIPKFIKKLFKKLFNFDDTMTNIFIMSMVCGTPSNAIFINDYLNKGLISVKNAENLLCITHFINPLFIINTVGINLFNSKKIGFLILILLYLSNIIKAIILRNNFIYNEKINMDKQSKTTIIESIIKSTKETIFCLLNIFSVIILFNMLTNLIKIIFNLNNISLFLINTILEMTGGITNLTFINIPIIIKIPLAYYLLSFGGLCIWMQVISSIQNKNIKYKTQCFY